MERTNKQRSGYFGIARLGGVAALNIQQLVHRSPVVGWDTITSHLILRHPAAPQSIRPQASRTLDDILVIIPATLPPHPAISKRQLALT